MKVKMKLDLASIKVWMLEHGEKLALAVVAVVVLLFTYSAIRREALDASKEPDKLRDLARSVGDKVQASRWDAKRERLQVVNYTERANSKLVDGSVFALVRPFNPPPTDPKARRDEPEVLGVEDLRAGSGYDVFSLKGDKAAGGGAGDGQGVKLHAQPWAVVTGLVPLERQKQAYAQAFGRAVGADPNLDVPQYYAPLLERAEVDEAQPNKVEWKRVPFADQVEEQWAGFADEIASTKYLDKQLTGRLGSLANTQQKWGETVSHPKVPLEGEENKQANEPAEPEVPESKAERAKEIEAGFQERDPKTDRQQPVVSPPQTTKPEVVEYRLLRAFDYSVKPGKKYRYRVTIGLKNPNYKRPLQYLKDPASARREQLAGKPSEATSVVTIPDGHRVLAGAVDAGTRYTEPSATLLVTAIDGQEGLEAATELTKVHRGVLANTEQKPVKVRHPISRQITELTLGFQSNILVLDIYGGRDLGKRKTPPIVTPGEILLLDADGNMTVRSELDDQAQYESSIVRDEPEPTTKPKPLLDNDKPKRTKKIKS
ncbi:MAG: hypothetical protein WD063_03665 [Pirellulales bacterium]